MSTYPERNFSSKRAKIIGAFLNAEKPEELLNYLKGKLDEIK